jgi:hypothetical protein
MAEAAQVHSGAGGGGRRWGQVRGEGLRVMLGEARAWAFLAHPKTALCRQPPSADGNAVGPARHNCFYIFSFILSLFFFPFFLLFKHIYSISFSSTSF